MVNTTRSGLAEDAVFLRARYPGRQISVAVFALLVVLVLIWLFGIKGVARV